ncbi:MAG: HigA family addiction module antitoxin [Candidatus Methylomirabilis sp.]|nr:HigA family addiction module antitoxin [Candidatus Methylomirabilis sp.]
MSQHDERGTRYGYEEPPHPGRIVRQECIEPLGLTVTDAAARLGITRQALNNLVNGKAGISPEMAIRLSKAFGSSPEVWLGIQMEYDLAQAVKQAGQIKVKRITVAISAHRP